MREEPFKFRIMKPVVGISDQVAQHVCILSEYPNYMYSVLIKGMTPGEQQTSLIAAIDALKIRLIQDIANAKFEYEK